MSKVAMNVRVRKLTPEDVPGCAELLAGLGDWFGIPEANVEYLVSLRTFPSFIAELDGKPAGFLALKQYEAISAEIYVIAVRRDLHRRGIGHALVEEAEKWCRVNGVQWLHVKTRGPSTPDPHYELTRQFYLSEGFDPLYESQTEWGPTNAALVMIRPVKTPESPTSPGDAPMPKVTGNLQMTCLTVDCADPAAVAHFWNEALQWGGVAVSKDGNGAICGPPGGGPYLEFIRVQEPKTTKNRLHLGCSVETLALVDSEIERLKALGATIAWEEEFPPEVASRYRNVVLRDVEGNEFCLGGGELVA